MFLTYNIRSNEKYNLDLPNELIKRFREKMDLQLLAS
jgi:hypothetical protein